MLFTEHTNLWQNWLLYFKDPDGVPCMRHYPRSPWGDKIWKVLTSETSHMKDEEQLPASILLLEDCNTLLLTNQPQLVWSSNGHMIQITPVYPFLENFMYEMENLGPL